MVIAYLRVSTEHQQLSHQKAEIERFAKSRNIEIDHWKQEVVSGIQEENTRILGKVLKKIGRGDILIVSELSRLSRTFRDILIILDKCIKKGALIYSVKERYEFGDSMNSKILGFAFGLVAEVERNLISMRTKEALSLLKAQGIVLGRPKGSSPKMKILADHAEEIQQLIRQKVNHSEIARTYRVSRATLFNYLKQLKNGKI